MFKTLLLLFSITCFAQKNKKIPLFHIAPEAVYLIDFDNSRNNQENIENGFFQTRNKEYIGALGINFGYNIGDYTSLGIYLGREEIFNRALNYNSWAFSSNFVLSPDKSSWAASFKIGSHFGEDLREGGFLGRFGIGFKFHILNIFIAQTEFVYSYQALKFIEVVDVETSQNLNLNAIGLSIKFYF